MSTHLLYLGLKAHVVAIDKNVGSTVWKTELKGSSLSGDRFVTLLVEDGRVFAHTGGQLHCLDAATGAVLWSNPLDGLGYGLASLAVPGIATSASLPHHLKQTQARAASGSTAYGGH